LRGLSWRFADPRARPNADVFARDFERIANAIRKDLADILQYRNEFEAAATWYRLNIPSAQREGAAASEVRKKKPKRGMKPAERRKLRSEKPKTLFELRKKAKQVEAAAREAARPSRCASP
jgi:hypothetical protein